MAKDDREIVHGIRMSVQKDAEGAAKTPPVFVAGMEDELAAALTQEQLDAAVERGDLSGTWKHLSAKKAEKSKE
jgi:hypothetical protein